MSAGRPAVVTLKQLTQVAVAAAVAFGIGWFVAGVIVEHPLNGVDHTDPAAQAGAGAFCAAVIGLLVGFVIVRGEPPDDGSPRVQVRWLQAASGVLIVAVAIAGYVNDRHHRRLGNARATAAVRSAGFAAPDEAWQLATYPHDGRPGGGAAALFADGSASIEARLMAGFMLIQADHATPDEKAAVFAMTRRAPAPLRAAALRALREQRQRDLNGDINLLFFQSACDPDPEVSSVARMIVWGHPYSCGAPRATTISQPR
jgi:hypothetical protein